MIDAMAGPGAPLSRRLFLKGMGAWAAASLMAGASASLAGCDFRSWSAATVEVEDMFGRRVAVPEVCARVFCTNPIGTANVYMLCPDRLAGWNFKPAGDNQKYLEASSLELPSLGVWMGAGAVPNAEEVAAQSPDVLLCFWTCDEVGGAMADDIAQTTRIPTLLIDYDIRSTPASFRYLGRLLGCEERAELLASYCEDKLAQIARIAETVPEQNRKSIFLAQGADGLTTDPVGSMHVQDALDIIGVTNVADMPGTEGQGMGMPTVNLEQVVAWNPDAVLVAEFNMSDAESSDIYHGLCQDVHWANVPCVAAGEVYRIPQGPFSWFGRPPSAARLLGCTWLLKVLYPDQAVSVDMRREVEDFYALFYGFTDFDDDLMERLLGPAEGMG